jgi:hypothetical protein
VDIMNWFASLPPADAVVPCGSGTHTVRWEAGQLTLPAHPDAEAELVLGALGGDKPACVTVAETWARHTDDVAVLGVGPRCAADEVSVSWDEVAQLRDGLPPGLAQAAQMTVTRTSVTRVARRVLGPAGMAGTASTAPTAGPGAPQPGPVPGRSPGLGAPAPAIPLGMRENLRRHQQRIELFELLALGPALQFRLSGTVCAAWAEPDRSEDRADRRRPALAAALTGRFAPAAQEWLGIDPDAVTVTPHEGQGWGTVRLTGAGQDRRLHAALPVGWLASVWACGLAVVDGHVVVAVDEPGYPEARVLALPTPSAVPVAITVHAKPDSPSGRPRWEVTDRP